MLRRFIPVGLFPVCFTFTFSVACWHLFQVSFTFGHPDCARYNEDFVISWFVISRFCSTHFTVISFVIPRTSLYRGSLNRGSTVCFFIADPIFVPKFLMLDSKLVTKSGVNRFVDRRIWGFYCSRIADFSDKLSGFDLKSTVDRGSAEKFGPDSGFCMSRSSDYGSDHKFSVGHVRYFGVSSTIFFFQFQVYTQRSVA